MTSSQAPTPNEVPQSSLARLTRTSLGMLAVMTALCGVAYPLLVTGVARAAFADEARGSLIVERGTVIGSRLIGQSFEGRRYFWGRPSATSPGPYNAAASSGSNLGPTNPELTKNARARIEALRAADPGNAREVPVDLVTASGSGLDPHISPAAAEYQLARVARACGIDVQRVRALVAANTEGRTLGILGEPRVNVTLLNLALDRLAE